MTSRAWHVALVWAWQVRFLKRSNETYSVVLVNSVPCQSGDRGSEERNGLEDLAELHFAEFDLGDAGKLLLLTGSAAAWEKNLHDEGKVSVYIVH